jgi:hypothetical protein
MKCPERASLGPALPHRPSHFNREIQLAQSLRTFQPKILQGFDLNRVARSIAVRRRACALSSVSSNRRRAAAGPRDQAGGAPRKGDFQIVLDAKRESHLNEKPGGKKCASAKPSYGERPAKLYAACHLDRGPRSDVTGRSAAVPAARSTCSASFTSIGPQKSVTGT